MPQDEFSRQTDLNVDNATKIATGSLLGRLARFVPPFRRWQSVCEALYGLENPLDYRLTGHPVHRRLSPKFGLMTTD